MASPARKLADFLNVPKISDFVSGLILSNNVSDANNDIDIGLGRARREDNIVVNTTVLTKRLDASWAQGTNQGGLDTGSKANSTTYHIHAIRHDSTGAFDTLFSTSVTSPTMPDGWTRIQRIGSVITDGSGNIRPFIQTGNVFRFNVNGGIVNYSAAGNRTKIFIQVTVPDGLRVEAIFEPTLLSKAASVGTMFIHDGENANLTVGITAGSLHAGGDAIVSYNSVQIRQYTNTSRQVYLTLTSGVNTSTPSTLATIGWNDYQIPRIG